MCIRVLIGMEAAYSAAASSLRRMRQERGGHYSSKKAVSVPPSSWKHKFVCLNSTTADRVPTSQSEKLLLEEAGLGEKVVTVPDLDCDVESFHQVLLGAYPKLEQGGGYELLRCRHQSRDLLQGCPTVQGC